VLEQLRSRDGAVLGHVTDDDHGRAALLGEAHQRRRALAQLLRRARPRFHAAGLQGLDRINHQQFGAALGTQRQDRFQRVVAK